MDKSNEIKQTWYKLTRYGLAHQHARMQIEQIADYATILKKGLNDAKPENYRDLIGIFRNLSINGTNLLEKIIDTSTCSKLFGIIIQSQATLSGDGHFDALFVIARIYECNKGKQQILLNQYIIEYIRKSLSKEYIELANQSAIILSMLIRDPSISINIMKIIDVSDIVIQTFLPNLQTYSGLDDNSATLNYKEIVELLKKRRIFLIKYNKKAAVYKEYIGMTHKELL